MATDAPSIGSNRLGSSFLGAFTLVETGHAAIGSAAYGRIRSAGSASPPSQPSYASAGRITGILLWMSPTRLLAVVVTTAKVRTHSPVAGSFQFSQRLANPKGARSFIAMANGCLTLLPGMTFHS